MIFTRIVSILLGLSLLTLVGAFLITLGSALFFTAVTSLTILCIGLGVLLLFLKQRKVDASPIDTRSTPEKPKAATIGLEGQLAKQNQLLAQWRKTSSIRDQLKLLKMSSDTPKPVE